jgi:hypothetical protein
VGGLLTFVHFVLLVTLATLGAGALVRGEYQRRSLQNWWSRMRPAGSPPAGGARNDMPAAAAARAAAAEQLGRRGDQLAAALLARRAASAV